jgi:hypothetical protein
MMPNNRKEEAMAISERVFYVICGILLLIGGVVFIWGGSSHPPTDARLGAVGSEEFFRNFVRHIVEHGNWQLIHTGILAGPLCWALGGIGASVMLRKHGEACFSVLGAAALAMGATAWAVTFVFDGFVALRYAQTIAANPPGDMTALLLGFQANQVVVIRLGLVSLILIGAGMAALGSSMISGAGPVRAVKQIIGATGILLGAWPTVAWAIGVFDPGPFTSRWWALTALLTTAWFMALGLMVLAQARSPWAQTTK